MHAKVRGQRVVLVDDVMTSGASLFTAAQVLRQAGAARITALVLARTEDK
jgi:predicted amidophosphoribosyltransferase